MESPIWHRVTSRSSTPDQQARSKQRTYRFFAGGRESGVDERQLAEELFDGSLSAGDLAAPFTVVRWRKGRLDIMNDMLGLVRLFHYEFDGGDIWSTRMGLAHVFMGELPKPNPLAWAGMAALGWAPGGATQLGSGKQVEGGVRISAGSESGRHDVRYKQTFAEWMDRARFSAEPSPRENVRDMESLMSTATRWPESPVGDLSGGKDSRLVSAMGIRSGAISTVRTIATDEGEVRTAKLLVQLLDTPVRHRITDRSDPFIPGGDFVERLSSQHSAWEGRFLATSGFNSPQFKGFQTARKAKFNGLGGEVLAGGSFYSGATRTRMMDATSSAAQDRLVRMTNSLGYGTSLSAKQQVNDYTSDFVKKAEGEGASTAAAVLDYFYTRDRMPNWSNTFTDEKTICPLFASSLLVWGARSTGNPVPDGTFHMKMLREALPAWADVPFYKPDGKSRITPFVWESADWSKVLKHVEAGAERSEFIDTVQSRKILEKVRSGEGSKQEEVFIHRVLWEDSFADYESIVIGFVQRVKAALSSYNNEQAS